MGGAVTGVVVVPSGGCASVGGLLRSRLVER